MSEKIIGYLLLSVGLLAIIFPVLNLFQVLNHQALPLSFFNLPGFKLDLSGFMPADVPSELNLNTSLELFSASDLNKIANLTVHTVFLSFVTGVGFKIATLGIQLLRPIQVKLQGN